MTTAPARAPIARAGSAGAAGVRLLARRLLLIFGGAVAAIALVTTLLVTLASPGAPEAPCPDGPVGCALPDRPPLVTRTPWRSSQYGFSLSFDQRRWSVAEESERAIVLRWRTDEGSPWSRQATLRIEGSAPDAPDVLVERRLETLRADIPDLAANDDPRREILTPAVAGRDGAGASYCGSIATPQGGNASVDVVVLAARSAGVGVTASLVSDFCGRRPTDSTFAATDATLNALRWPAEAAAASLSRGGAPAPAIADAVSCCVLVGPTDPATPLRLSVVLRPRDGGALRGALRELTAPGSPGYRRFIAPAEFGARFGPRRADLLRVERRLRGAGLAIVGAYPQRTALEVSGSAGAVRRLFGVRLADYRDGAGRRFHAPLGAPVVPPDLRAAVAGVAGLNGRPVAIRADIPAEGLSPLDAARAYNVTPLWRRGLRGQGQTIAVVSFASFDQRDLDAFDRRTGTSGPRVERIPVNGGTTDTVSDNAREVALDLQVVRGVAPRAQILNYEVPYTGLSSFATGIGAAIDAIVRDGRADIVSISYGLCDVPTSLSGFPFLDDADRMRAELAIQAAVARGISVFVATQDQGAYACQLTDLADHRLATSWPGNSPGVISVGGTLLSVREDGAYLEESGWEDVISIGGGGGGHNPRAPRPEWQRGPGVTNALTTGARQVPDVAAAADPESGFLVIFEGRERVIGGTSAATPFWAGSMALVRQLAERERVGRLGFAAPMLYEIGATGGPAFHDVTRGGNRHHDAGPGWDYSTGLGSPDVWHLARRAVDFLRARPGG